MFIVNALTQYLFRQPALERPDEPKMTPKIEESKVIERIQDFAKKGIFSDSKSEYYDYITKCRKISPALNNQIKIAYANLIGNTYTPMGGFGAGHENIFSYAYGLSFAGVRKALELKMINSLVVETSEELKNMISTLEEGSRLAIAASASIFIDDEISQCHAIAVLLRLEKGNLTFMILDSQPCNEYDKNKIAASIGKDLTLSLMVSKVRRQARSALTCYAFAINDCDAFQKDPRLIETIISLNDGASELTILPSELMKLSTNEEDQKEALKLQGMLVYASVPLGIG